MLHINTGNAPPLPTPPKPTKPELLLFMQANHIQFTKSWAKPKLEQGIIEWGALNQLPQNKQATTSIATPTPAHHARTPHLSATLAPSLRTGGGSNQDSSNGASLPTQFGLAGDMQLPLVHVTGRST